MKNYLLATVLSVNRRFHWFGWVVQMMRFCLVILLLFPHVFGLVEDRTVLLAAHRAGGVEVLDPDTLQPLGSIILFPLTDGVAAGSGGMIFLKEGIGPDFKGCCDLYALDLKTLYVTKLLHPVVDVLVSPSGAHLIAQRGDSGIESFDTHSLRQESRIPPSIAPGG